MCVSVCVVFECALWRICISTAADVLFGRQWQLVVVVMQLARVLALPYRPSYTVQSKGRVVDRVSL